MPAAYWSLRESIEKFVFDARYAVMATRLRGGRDEHERFTGSSEGHLKGEKDRDRKNLVNNQQEIEVDEADNLMVMK